MIRRITRRIRIMVDRFLIRTEPMGAMNQIHWGMELADVIFEEASKKKRMSGAVLYEFLPPEMASTVIRRWFDPYEKIVSKSGLRDWLWAHVIFDEEGSIIAIHDRGKILICQNSWQSEADWFSRVKMNVDGIWTRANQDRERHDS